MTTHIARTQLVPGAKLHVALRKIFGIGATSALNVCESCGISSDMKVKDVKEQYLQKVAQHIQDNHVVGDQLKRSIRDRILELIAMQTVRGDRHEKGLSLHGHTKSNNQTAKKLRHHIMYDTSRG